MILINIFSFLAQEVIRGEKTVEEHTTQTASKLLETDLEQAPTLEFSAAVIQDIELVYIYV